MRYLITLLLVAACSFTFAQRASYFDPAQAYNRLLIEKNNGSFTRVGNFKVVGTSFLYGQKNKGDMYAIGETGNGVLVSYDTYSQIVYFFPSGSPDVSLAKEPSMLDSFTIRKNLEVNLEEDIHFVYGPLIGAKDKNYYQLIARGNKVSLYKRYTAELGMVTTNYIQTELRQFNILVDYYYTDSTGKDPKKLKISPKTIAKEFAPIKDIAKFINADYLTEFRERELVRIVGEVNRE